MPNLATVREQRLRKTKAQLIDEIDTLEQRAAAIEATYRSDAPMRAKAIDRYLANQELAPLTRFLSENPSPVLRVMPDGTVLYANDAAIAVNRLLMGRKKSTLARDLVGVCAEASRTAEVQETEFKSGDRVFAFSIAPVTGETYINIYGRDVTDAHNTRLALEAANEASAAAEARLKAIIDNSPATICLKDAKGRYQLVNKHFTELHGMTADAMLGKTAHELFPKEIADPFRAHDRRVLRTGVAEEREQVVTTPGGPRTFNEIKFPITANGEQSTVNAIGLIATDITERKRAERELAEKEAQLHLALDNMPGGMRLTDKDRNYVFFNSQYLNLYDFPEGLLKVGESIRVENLYCARRGDMGPGNPEKLTDDWLADSRELMKLDGWERRIGDEKILQVKTSPIPGGGVISIAIDITERKRAEEKLAEKEAQLRLALDNMPGGMELVDRDWNYVLFNPKYSELHDYPDGLLKVGGSVLDEMRFQAERGDYGPGDPDKLMEEAHVPFRSGEPESYERTLPGGRTLHFNVAPTPEGGYVTIATDITELKRKTAELAELNQNLEKRVADQLVELERISQLKRFFSPQLAELIVSAGDDKFMESHRQEITVVFCDLRNFTEFSATAEPEEQFRVLREYHEVVGSLIFRYEATLEHFAGDGVMSFFNDPIPCPDPTARAVRMAIDMRDEMDGLLKKWEKRGFELGFGAGVALGYATLGQVGFEGQFHYMAIGSVANLASRLCDEAKDGQILITQRIFAEIEDIAEVEPVGEHTFKGFHKPISAFQVIGMNSSSS